MNAPKLELEEIVADPPAAVIKAKLTQMGAEHVALYRGRMEYFDEEIELNVLRSWEPIGLIDRRWHISVSCEAFVPPWFVMVEVAHELRPGVPFVVGIPPRSWWINVHPNTLHLWELKDPALIEQWRAERAAMKPTAGEDRG